MMNFFNFRDYLVTSLEKYYGDDYSIMLLDNSEKNNLSNDKLAIVKLNETCFSPVIDLYDAYFRYTKGEEPQDIVLEIIKVADESMDPIDISDYTSFSIQRNRVHYQLVNINEYAKDLEKIVHFNILGDMAVVFYTEIATSKGEKVRLNVTENVMQEWNTDVTTLWKLAKNNSKRKDKYRLTNIYSDIWKEFAKNEHISERDIYAREIFFSNFRRNLAKEYRGVKIYVLNGKNQNAAKALFSDNILRNMYKKFKMPMYFLPQTNNDVIVVAAKPFFKHKALKVIRSFEKNDVPDELLLSKKIYVYNGKELTII